MNRRQFLTAVLGGSIAIRWASTNPAGAEAAEQIGPVSVRVEHGPVAVRTIPDANAPADAIVQEGAAGRTVVGQCVQCAGQRWARVEFDDELMAGWVPTVHLAIAA